MAKKHWEYESVKRSNERSAAKIYRQVKFDFHREYEADILEKLDSVENKRQYIISLIRADISKEKTRE